VIRFGILGFGLHAVKRLMPGFRLAQKASVTALSRRDLWQAQASAREFGIPLAFGSAEDLCRSPEVDAVFVSTANACHCADVLLALRHGKPVLCEKPMGMNAAECGEMVETARRAGLLLGVAQVFRFGVSTRRMREVIAFGEIGRPVFARAEFCFPGRGHRRSWLTQRAVAGGGPLADVGVHCIDALRMLLQDEVIRVSARAVSDSESEDVEATAAATLEFAQGALGVVFVSTRAAYRTPLEIVGTEGVLRADNALSVQDDITLELLREGKLVRRETVNNCMAYARQVDAFAAALEETAEFPAPGVEGWRNQLVLDAAYRSIQTGRREAP
jgi:1,5-anhydro-D-fructose reductase (1,5-anhydro-D-mannitol-forming)